MDENYTYMLNDSGVKAYDRGDYEEAVKCYDKAIKIDPIYAEAWENRGDALVKCGRHDEAILSFNKVLEINKDGDDPWRWNNLGNEFYESGKLTAAVKYYDRSIQADLRYMWAWRNKGLALAELGKYEDAIECYEKATEIEPANIEVLEEKGNVLEGVGNYREALSVYGKVIQIDRNYMKARGDRGSVLYKIGNYKEALEDFDEVIEADPENHTAWLYKIRLLKKLGRKGDALEICKIVKERITNELKDKSGSSELWIRKGDVLLEAGEVEEASECYKRCLEIDENNEAGLRRYALLLGDYTNDYQKAVEISARLEKRFPDSIREKMNLAEAYVKLGEYEEGKKLAVATREQTDNVFDRCIMDVIIIASYVLEGNCEAAEDEFTECLRKYEEMEMWTNIEDTGWKFDGLVNAIKKSNSSTRDIFLVITLTDLLNGKIKKEALTFFRKS